jgi:hypothetical protein
MIGVVHRFEGAADRIQREIVVKPTRRGAAQNVDSLA